MTYQQVLGFGETSMYSDKWRLCLWLYPMGTKAAGTQKQLMTGRGGAGACMKRKRKGPEPCRVDRAGQAAAASKEVFVSIFARLHDLRCEVSFCKVACYLHRRLLCFHNRAQGRCLRRCWIGPRCQVGGCKLSTSMGRGLFGTVAKTTRYWIGRMLADRENF